MYIYIYTYIYIYIRWPLRGHQAVRMRKSMLDFKRSFKVEAQDLQSKRISSRIEILKFLCRKVLCFFVSMSLGRAPERHVYHQPPPALPVWKPPGPLSSPILLRLGALVRHLALS